MHSGIVVVFKHKAYEDILLRYEYNDVSDQQRRHFTMIRCSRIIWFRNQGGQLHRAKDGLDELDRTIRVHEQE